MSLPLFRLCRALPLLALLLGGCASLTSYTVTEQEINDYLAARAGFEQRLGIPGLMSADVRLGEMKSRIGRAVAERVELDAAGDLSVATPIGKQAMQIALTLSARPVYAREEGAIYLRDLEVKGIKTTPANLGAAMTPLLPMLSLSLSQFLEKTPVYRLNDTRQYEAQAKDKVAGLNVAPGKLVIPFDLL